jgi:signal transduction histidine kinase
VSVAGFDRARLLVASGIALSSELSLEALLRRLIETAVELTGARYGALGVIDRAGTGLSEFIAVGIGAETRAMLGDLPRGRGVLGVLISERRPLRLANLADDPRSVGFPPGHPPMVSFLGCPVTLRGTDFGNLYLTEKFGDAGFSVEDEEVVALLASQAAVAIENARLFESSQLWSRQLESLNEVSDALVSQADLSQLLALAADGLRGLIDARVVMIQLPTPDGLSLTVEAASGEWAERLLGLRLRPDTSKGARTLTRMQSERIDTLIDDPEVDQSVPRLVEASSALYVPLIVRERAVGVIVAYDKSGADSRFSDADMRVAQAFANRAAIALELSERVRRESVRALLNGQESERARLARDLHDETGQALASILLGLKAVEQEIGKEPLAEIRELVASALGDVRRLATELRPSSLDDFGLQPALELLVHQVALQSGLHIQLRFSLVKPLLTADQETALYRIVQEALTNAVKHAKAQSISIVVASNAGSVRTVIEDDGDGFTTSMVRDGAFGLVGMRERVMLLDGRFTVESAEGSGTTVVIELPT